MITLARAAGAVVALVSYSALLGPLQGIDRAGGWAEMYVTYLALLASMTVGALVGEQVAACKKAPNETRVVTALLHTLRDNVEGYEGYIGSRS
ncbi:MAG: hypothetical protein ACR2JB_27585 [Bryobacteraceae bacterium]